MKLSQHGAAPITVAVQDPDGLTIKEKFLRTIAGDILIEFRHPANLRLTRERARRKVGA